jgi:hypothetical protein
VRSNACKPPDICQACNLTLPSLPLLDVPIKAIHVCFDDHIEAARKGSSVFEGEKFSPGLWKQGRKEATLRVEALLREAKEALGEPRSSLNNGVFSP